MDPFTSVMTDFDDGASNSFDNDAPALQCQYEKRVPIPIVYTTKLDDMEVIKDNNIDISINTFINSIIKESKPKFNLKRKCSSSHSHNSYKDLSCQINAFNRKVARITAHNHRLLSLCKPVKIVLVDIKNTLLSAAPDSVLYYPLRQSIDSGNSKKRPHNAKLKITLIIDKQHNEVDMYALDKTYNIKEYRKFRTESNDDILPSLLSDENVWKFTCCCWYNREKILKCMTHPLETIRFMRKPHNCSINLCSCCCRNSLEHIWMKHLSSIRQSSQKPSKSRTMWLNKTTKIYESLPTSDISKNTLVSKSLRVVHKPPKKENVVKEYNYPFLHSTNIDFGHEYYVIGTDGQIKLHFKKSGNDRHNVTNLPKSADSIVGNICCWYRREEFASRLLALNALPNTVNYIRGAHLCSSTNCGCCCKPAKPNKVNLIQLNKVARHTNDLASKKVNIIVKFSRTKAENFGFLKTVNANRLPKHDKNDKILFNVSLSAMDIILKNQNGSCPRDVFDLLIPERGTLDHKSNIRVIMERIPGIRKKATYHTVIECSDLKNFTTKELTMLDVIFRAVNKATKEPAEWRNTHAARSLISGYSNTIYPLLLNAQLTVTTDLRNKRFLPPLRAQLDKQNFPPMKSIRAWLNNEARLTKMRQNLNLGT